MIDLFCPVHTYWQQDLAHTVGRDLRWFSYSSMSLVIILALNPLWKWVDIPVVYMHPGEGMEMG